MFPVDSGQGRWRFVVDRLTARLFVEAVAACGGSGGVDWWVCSASQGD
ncbi:unnamed protein product [Arabidopsis halleri]